LLSLRKFKGKKLVSYLRQGDYSHPGEIESIELVMQSIPKNKQNLVLDVGCGLGGTADYLHQKNYGQIYGLDIESDAIEYAEAIYPNVTFKCGDVIDTHNMFQTSKFDVFVLFNAFYAFTDQMLALEAIRRCAKPNSDLLIFDYSLAEGKESYKWTTTSSSFTPLVLSTIAETLMMSGWKLVEKRDITSDYHRWYHDLCQRLEKKSAYIIEHFSQASFDESTRVYSNILDDLSKGDLGGAIIHAKAE